VHHALAAKAFGPAVNIVVAAELLHLVDAREMVTLCVDKAMSNLVSKLARGTCDAAGCCRALAVASCMRGVSLCRVGVSAGGIDLAEHAVHCVNRVSGCKAAWKLIQQLGLPQDRFTAVRTACLTGELRWIVKLLSPVCVSVSLSLSLSLSLSVYLSGISLCVAAPPPLPALCVTRHVPSSGNALRTVAQAGDATTADNHAAVASLIDSFLRRNPEFGRTVLLELKKCDGVSERDGLRRPCNARSCCWTDTWA
jgi:hypothetical protein